MLGFRKDSAALLSLGVASLLLSTAFSCRILRKLDSRLPKEPPL